MSNKNIPANAQHATLINKLRDLLAVQCANGVSAQCVAVADALYEKSLVTQDADKKSMLAAASVQLRNGEKNMRKTIERDAAKYFDGRLKHDANAAATRTQIFTLDSMTLQDDMEVQENILVSDAVKKLKEVSDFEFFSVTMRLQFLMGRHSLSDRDNPLFPRVYSRALLAGIDAIDVTPTARLVIFTAFQSHLQKILPAMYREANKMLIAQKILPDIVETYGKPVIAPSRPARLPLGGGGGGNNTGQTYAQQYGGPSSAFSQTTTQPQAFPAYPQQVPQGQPPQYPAGQAPQYPAGQAPQYPAGQVPQYPVGQAPQYPAGQAPQYPAGQAPQYPAGQAPQYPAGQAPQYPAGQAPQYPAGQAPQYPAGQAPQYPAGQAPQYPAGQVPQYPQGQQPQYPQGQPQPYPSGQPSSSAPAGPANYQPNYGPSNPPNFAPNVAPNTSFNPAPNTSTNDVGLLQQPGGGGGFGGGGGGGGGGFGGVGDGGSGAASGGGSVGSGTGSGTGGGTSVGVGGGTGNSALDQSLIELLGRLTGGLTDTRLAGAGGSGSGSGGAGGSGASNKSASSSSFLDSNRTYIASILFLDVVGYSKLKVAEQMKLKSRFNEMLKAAVKDIPEDTHFTLDTGDGAALSFLGDPEDALYAAMQLRDFFASEKRNPMSVRMGINLGPVKLIRDVNGQRNIVGDGINSAQRVMNFSTPGSLLVSRSYFEVVSVMCDEYSHLFTAQGVLADKHEREHWVYLVESSADAFERAKAGVIERASSHVPNPAMRNVEVMQGLKAQLKLGTSLTVESDNAAEAENLDDTDDTNAITQTNITIDSALLEAINQLQAGWSMVPPDESPTTVSKKSAKKPIALLDDFPTIEKSSAAEETLKIAALGDDDTDMEVVPQVEQRIYNVLHQVREKLTGQMTPENAAVTSLLATIFDRIFDDADLPNAIKALLGELQIPALKAAMLNAELFTDAQHPMRVLIDRIATLGEQRGQSLQRDAALFPPLKLIVHTLQSEFVTEISVIEKALATLDKLLESEDAAIDTQTAAVMEELELEERTQQAQSRVNREIKSRLNAYHYPAVVEIFINVAWRKVLQHDFMDGGEAGAFWQSSITALNALLWSVRPDIIDGSERTSLLRLIPALSTRLNVGLDRAGIPGTGRELFFNELLELHRTILKPPKPAKPASRKPPEVSIADEQPIEISIKNPAENIIAPLPVALSPTVDKDWPVPAEEADVTEPVEVVEELMLRGQWIRLRIEDDIWHPCKLTWMSPSKENYVFKDYETQSALTISAFDLKNKLRSGDAHRIDSASLTKRSIDGAVAELLTQVAPQAAEPVLAPTLVPAE